MKEKAYNHSPVVTAEERKMLLSHLSSETKRKNNICKIVLNKIREFLSVSKNNN